MTILLDFAGDRHPFAMRDIKVREDIIPFASFQDGILPGMTAGKKTQTATVKCFRNLIEYTRIVESETVLDGDTRHLLASYFVNRSIGWAAEEYKPKEGKTVGYYLNGSIYSAGSHTRVLTALYQVHFVDVVRKKIYFLEAMEDVKAGEDVKITGLDNVDFPRLTSLLYLALQNLFD